MVAPAFFLALVVFVVAIDTPFFTVGLVASSAANPSEVYDCLRLVLIDVPLPGKKYKEDEVMETGKKSTLE